MTMPGTRPPETGAGGAAQELADLVTPLFGGELPMRLRAWDGSAAGPEDAPTLVVNDAAALRRLVYRPGELGLAQAYVSGEIDVEGDLLDGFRRVWRSVRERDASPRLTVSTVLAGLRTARSLGALGWPTATAARLAGTLAGTAALADPGPRRDRAPLRPVQRLLRAHPRPAPGLLVRVLHAGPGRRVVLPRAGAARQARPGLPQARPRRGVARPPPPRHRLWLGLAVAVRRRGVRRPGRRGHDRRRAEGLHRPADRRAGAAGPRRDPAAGLPGRRGTDPSTRSPRSRWASTSARRTTRSSPAGSTGCCGPVDAP